MTDDLNAPTIVGDVDDDPDDDSAGGRRKWWHDKSVVVFVVLLGVGILIVVRGILVGVTGDDRAKLPNLIESVSPVPEAVQVLSQSNVFVDLAADHTGVLVIDGIEIDTVAVDDIGRIDVEPGEQVDLPPVSIYEPGNATLTFTPGDGAPIESFDSGDHQVEVIYWPLDEGRGRALSYRWTFTVV